MTDHNYPGLGLARSLSFWSNSPPPPSLGGGGGSTAGDSRHLRLTYIIRLSPRRANRQRRGRKARAKDMDFPVQIDREGRAQWCTRRTSQQDAPRSRRQRHRTCPRASNSACKRHTPTPQAPAGRRSRQRQVRMNSRGGRQWQTFQRTRPKADNRRASSPKGTGSAEAPVRPAELASAHVGPSLAACG